MNPFPIDSGSKFRKSIFGQDKLIPNCEPCEPIYPESNGRSLPTPPTEKLLVKRIEYVSQEHAFDREPHHRVSSERVKRAAIPAPAETDTDLYKELEKLRIENARLKDDKVGLINQYEERIKILLFQNSDKTDYLRKIAQLEEERALLIEEINRLRLRNATLEAQFEDNKGHSKEKEELYRVIDGLKYRITELESSTLRNSQISELERKTLDAQKLKLFNYENRIVMFMIEIERLGNIVAEIQKENEELTLQLSKNDFRDQLRVFEAEKSILNNQIREYRIKIEEYDSHLIKLVLLSAEVERLNNLLSEKTRGDAVVMKADYEARIRSLMMESANWSEKYRLLENARLAEVQTIITQNATLSKQVNMSNSDSQRLIALMKDLESEHKHLGEKYQQVLRELEDARRNQNALYVDIDQSPTKRALKDSLSQKIQSIGYTTSIIQTQKN